MILLAQVTADVDPTLLAGELLKAIGSGQWALVAVLAVVALTVVGKRVGSRWWPWLDSVAGATMIATVGSVGGALATALLAGEALTMALVLKAVLVAVVALVPSAATVAAAKGQAAAANVVDLKTALDEINK